MDVNVDYPSPLYLSDVDTSESAPSTPEPYLSDPRSLRLSDAAHSSNSNDVVCHVHWHVLGSRQTLLRLLAPRSLKCDGLELLSTR